MKNELVLNGYLLIFLLVLINSFIQGNCYHDAVIGGQCRYDEDCFTEHAFCYHHEICACKDGFIVTDDLERCIATVGGICRSRHDCSETLFNSHCVEEKCSCVKGYVPDSYQLNCIQVAFVVGDPCREDIQCQETMGDYSHCLNERCFCQPDHHFINGKCLKSRKLYEPCNTWHDCFIGKEYNNSVDCVDGTCKCKHGFYHTPDNKCNYLNTASKTTDELFTYIFVLFTVYFTVFH